MTLRLHFYIYMLVYSFPQAYLRNLLFVLLCFVFHASLLFHTLPYVFAFGTKCIFIWFFILYQYAQPYRTKIELNREAEESLPEVRLAFNTHINILRRDLFAIKPLQRVDDILCLFQWVTICMCLDGVSPALQLQINFAR